MMAILREFSVVAETCRAAMSGHQLAVQDPLVDWSRVVRLARFHRVSGLVWHSLVESAAQLPGKIAHELAADARTIAQANLAAAVESRSLMDAFYQAGIPILFIKGLTLATIAYGTISTKSSIDIDILVPESQMLESATVLQSLGYELVCPKVGAALSRLQQWHRHRKESGWRHPVRGTQIDLHTQLSDNRRIIPGVGIRSPKRDIEVAPGIALPTLGADHLFAYLCVHGSSSLWFRLKWIADLAALISRESGSEIERLYRRSQELGAARAPAQALLLADTLFNSLEVAPQLRAELSADRASAGLLRAALRQLSVHRQPREPTATAFGTARIHYSQFLLAPGMDYKMSELLRHARLALDQL